VMVMVMMVVMVMVMVMMMYCAVLCQAKRIVSYMARARPDRLVDEIISELRVCLCLVDTV